MPKSAHTSEYELFRGMLVEARTKKGIGQRELARQLGMSHSILNKIESGYRRLDMVEFVQIMHALGLEPAKFVAKFDREAEKLKSTQ